MNYPKKQIAMIAFLIFGILLLMVLLIVTRVTPSAEMDVREEETGGRSSGQLSVDRKFGALPPPKLPKPSSTSDSKAGVSKNTQVVNSIPDGAIKNLPATGQVQQLGNQPVATKQVGEIVAANLDIPGPPERVKEHTLEWFGEKYDVIIDDDEHYLFVFKQVPDFTLPAPSVQNAIAIASDFLRDRGC